MIVFPLLVSGAQPGENSYFLTKFAEHGDSQLL
jgi:hypothetical protein